MRNGMRGWAKMTAALLLAALFLIPFISSRAEDAVAIFAMARDSAGAWYEYKEGDVVPANPRALTFGARLGVEHAGEPITVTVDYKLSYCATPGEKDGALVVQIDPELISAFDLMKAGEHTVEVASGENAGNILKIVRFTVENPAAKPVVGTVGPLSVSLDAQSFDSGAVYATEADFCDIQWHADDADHYTLRITRGDGENIINDKDYRKESYRLSLDRLDDDEVCEIQVGAVPRNGTEAAETYAVKVRHVVVKPTVAPISPPVFRSGEQEVKSVTLRNQTLTVTFETANAQSYSYSIEGTEYNEPETKNAFVVLDPDKFTAGRDYTLRVGALPEYGEASDMVYSELPITCIAPPTSMTVTIDGNAPEDYAIDQNVILTREAHTFKWPAEGTDIVYDYAVTYRDTGRRFDGKEGLSEGTFTLKADDSSPDADIAYEVKLTARPKNGSAQDEISRSYTVIRPAPLGKVTVYRDDEEVTGEVILKSGTNRFNWKTDNASDYNLHCYSLVITEQDTGDVFYQSDDDFQETDYDFPTGDRTEGKAYTFTITALSTELSGSADSPSTVLTLVHPYALGDLSLTVNGARKKDQDAMTLTEAGYTFNWQAEHADTRYNLDRYSCALTDAYGNDTTDLLTDVSEQGSCAIATDRLNRGEQYTLTLTAEPRADSGSIRKTAALLLRRPAAMGEMVIQQDNNAIEEKSIALTPENHTFTWKAAGDDGSNVKGYCFSVKDEGGNVYEEQQTPQSVGIWTFDARNLVRNMTYTAELTALPVAGEEPVTQTLTLVCRQQMGAITAKSGGESLLSALKLVGDSVTITWSAANTDRYNLAGYSYTLESAAGGDKTHKEGMAEGVLELKADALKDGETYTLTLNADPNDGFDRPEPKVVTVTRPGKLGGITATWNRAQVKDGDAIALTQGVNTFTWFAANASEDNLRGYSYRVKDSKGNQWLDGSSADLAMATFDLATADLTEGEENTVTLCADPIDGSAPITITLTVSWTAPVAQPCEVGDTVTFGQNSETGEPLEWRVLKTEGDLALLYCKSVVAQKAYSDKETSTSWETSPVRLYLKDVFRNQYFNGDQQKALIATKTSDMYEDEFRPPTKEELQEMLPNASDRKADTRRWLMMQNRADGKNKKGDNTTSWLDTDGAFQSGKVKPTEELGVQPMVWISKSKAGFAALVDISADNIRGQTVNFGKYYGSPIQWYVLQNDNGVLTLISRYILDGKPFNEAIDGSSAGTTWKDCTLQDDLNTAFFYSAVDKQLRGAVKPVEIDGVEYNVWLLSADEFNRWFGDSAISRIAMPSDYYKNTSGAYANDGIDFWWLRDMADDAGANALCALGSTGQLMNSGGIPVTIVQGIRPAICVDTAKLK